MDSWHVISRRTPIQDDFDLFAAISGDDNPIHIDAEFSGRTRFGRTVSHGMLLYSWCWALLREHYPQARSVCDSLMFPNPAFSGEELEFCVAQQRDHELDMLVRRTHDQETVLTLTSQLQDVST